MTEAELVDRLANGRAEQKLDALRALDRRKNLGAAALDALARALGDGDKVQLTEPDFTPWSGGGWEAVEYDRVDALAQRVLGQQSVAALPALTDALAVPGCARRATELIALLPALELATLERAELERAQAALRSVVDKRARMTERALETLAWVLDGGDNDAVKVLLEHPSDAERERALDLVRELPEPARTEAHVAAILGQGNFPKSRYWALERLLTMEPDPDALAPLVKQLASQHLRSLWPRLFALVSKNRLHDAMPTLVRFLSGEIEAPRKAKKRKELLASASRTLGSLSKDDDRANEVLITLYLDPPKQSRSRLELRALVVTALGGPVRAGEHLEQPLIEVLAKEDASRVEDAANALGLLRHGAAAAGPPLAEAFERMAARVAANPILERLGPSPPLRAAGAIAGVMARRGPVPGSMVQGLVLLLEHRLVRPSAVAALGHLEGQPADRRAAEEALERLLPDLQERRDSGDRRRVNDALAALREERKS